MTKAEEKKGAHYSMWRGVAGLVKPTRRPGSLETLIRLLPEGIGVVPLLLNVRAGSHAEFSSAIPHYEKHVAELAEQGMDVIHPGGTPPFMLQGYEGEAKLIKSWEKKYDTPIFTSGQNHVNAMRALGIKKFIGASYSALQNKIVIDYMTEAGFKVVSMEPIDVPFNEAQHISPERLYAHIKQLFREHKGADGIYYSVWQSSSFTAASNTLSTSIGPGCAYNQSLGPTGKLTWTVGGTSSPNWTFTPNVYGK